MAFTVEDGTGLATANSYLSVADADAYHLDRGNGGWAGTPAEKQQALITATEYVDGRFGHLYRGLKLTAAQRLEWPRADAFDDEGNEYANDAVPGKLEDAIAEYALRVRTLGQQFFPDPVLGYSTRDTVGSGDTQVTGAGIIAVTKEKVGPIEEEVAYESSSSGGGGASSGSLPSYPFADMLLDKLLNPAWITGRA